MMNSSHDPMTIRKQYLEVPPTLKCSTLRKAVSGFIGMFLAPLYLAAAAYAGGPGVGVHLRCMWLGLSLFLTGKISIKDAVSLFFSPMDSTRYFEFHEIFLRKPAVSAKNYLDISSPRLVPLFLLMSSTETSADLINPDLADLQRTEKMMTSLGLQQRCRFHSQLLGAVPLKPASFDLITCVSVLEHIPDDRQAVATMWNLLRPGGRLVLTFPSMAHPLEQYISYNPFGVLTPGDDGYTFWQRYYDRQRIQDVICSVAGQPLVMKVYGEKVRGCFLRNAMMKRIFGHRYPIWQESFMMAREYRYFDRIEDLPGEGVVYLEFVKS
ncbi:MAG TPA: methyltransferase domain-containing protein [Geobacteraceae bacterium]